MPKIQWTSLPEALRDHLFKLCEGQYPKTFLLPGQAARGVKLDD